MQSTEVAYLRSVDAGKDAAALYASQTPLRRRIAKRMVRYLGRQANGHLKPCNLGCLHVLSLKEPKSGENPWMYMNTYR